MRTCVLDLHWSRFWRVGPPRGGAWGWQGGKAAPGLRAGRVQARVLRHLRGGQGCVPLKYGPRGAHLSGLMWPSLTLHAPKGCGEAPRMEPRKVGVQREVIEK